MTRDGVVAFPLSDPAVPSEGIPGCHTTARDLRPRPLGATVRRDALAINLALNLPVNLAVKSLRSKFRVTSWWLEEGPRPSYARPPYVCWPPLKPGLPALQS